MYTAREYREFAAQCIKWATEAKGGCRTRIHNSCRRLDIRGAARRSAHSAPPHIPPAAHRPRSTTTAGSAAADMRKMLRPLE